MPSKAASAARKATGPQGRAAVKRVVGGTAKAAGAEVAGGGPEDPAADIIALKEVAGTRKSRKPATSSRGGTSTGKTSSTGRSTPRPRVGRRTRAVAWAWSGDKKLLTAEFILVIAILGLGTLTTPGNVKDELPKTMVKFAALMGLFFILAIMTGAGKGSAKVATALATLITVGYVFTSPEARQIVAWVGAYFKPPQSGGGK